MAWDLHSTSRTTIWAIFAGWCIGVLGASCQRSLRNPGGRPGVFLAGGHQKSWLVAL
jgi:ABC-type Fe3+-siderophore transport system permease subunit